MAVVATSLATALGGSALGTALGATATLAISQVVVGVTGNLLLSAVFADRPESRRAFSQQSSRTQGALVPQTIGVGRFATMGSDIFPPYCHDSVPTIGQSGGVGAGQGRYMTLGVALSDVPIDGFVGLVLQGQEFTAGQDLVDNGHVYGMEIPEGRAEEIDRYRGKIWVRFYDGAQTVADPMMLAAYGDHPTRPYVSDMTYAGGAYALVTVLQDNELWTDLRAVKFILRGIRIDGVYTANPISHAANIAEGITLPGGQVFRAGYDDIDADAKAAAEAEVASAGFACGLEIPVGTPDGSGINALDAIEQLLITCGGAATDVGGTLFLDAMTRGLPVAHMTDANVDISRTQTADLTGSQRDKVNGVAITHPDNASKWAEKQTPTEYDAALVAEDGEPLARAVSIPALYDTDQARKLALMMIAESRRVRVHALPVSGGLSRLRPQSKITWTSEEFGYTAKEFIVESKSVLGPETILNIRESDPDDFNPDAITLGPYTPAVPVVQVPGPLTMALAVAPVTIGDTVPVAGLRFVINDMPPAATGWTVAVRVAGQTAEQILTFDRNTLAVDAALAPNTTYEVRGRYQSVTRASVWTSRSTATTDDIRLDVDLLDDAVWDAIAEDATDITNALLVPALEPIQGDIVDVQAGLDAANIAQINASDVLADIGDNLLWAVTNAQQTSSLIRDAGIYVDPENGTVRISGVEQLAGQISDVAIELNAQQASLSLRATYAEVEGLIAQAAFDPSSFADFTDLQIRMSSAEIELDALASAILLKADNTTVDGIDVRLQSAEVNIDALVSAITLKVETSDFNAVETRLQTAEITLDALDGPSIVQAVSDTQSLQADVDISAINSLEALLYFYQTRETLRTDLAFATQDIRALVTEDREAIAEQGVSLGAAIDQNAALLQVERTARANADSALASSVEALGAEATRLSDGVTGNAGAINTLTTRVDTAEGAITTQAADITQLAAGLAGLSGDTAANATAISSLSTSVSDTAGLVSAQANQISTLFTEVGENTATITQTAQTVEGIQAEFTIRLDVNGHISGLVLRSELNDAGAVVSDAAFIADKFAIVGPGDTPETPFVVYTTPQVIDGITYQPGVYTDKIVIREASIGSAQIQDTIQSNNFVAGQAGWRIQKDGAAEFNAPVISRQIVLNEGSFTLAGQNLNDGDELKFINSGIIMGRDDIYRAAERTVLVRAAITSLASGPSNIDGLNAFSGIEANVLGGFRWSGFQLGAPALAYRRDPATTVAWPGATGTDQRLFFNLKLTTEGGIFYQSPTIEWTAFLVT